MNINNVFEIQPMPQFTLIRFYGFVDASTVSQIRPVLHERLSDTCRHIVVDLREVGFLDSHGVGLFVSLLKLAHKNNGRIVFAAAKGQPSSVLQMVGFNGGLVSYCHDIEEACASFEKKAV